jgi:DHA1 family bicyclomycin/chloramphenicol resistance-like MFS transporter
LQNVYGLSPQVYGLVFALNACGMVIGAQVNGALASRFGPSTLLTAGLVTMLTAGSILVTVVVTGAVGLPGVIPSLFAFMFGCGFVGPNAVALGLQHYPHAAGAASALIGSLQFMVAAIVAPLAGIRGTADALPMALLMLVLPASALGFRMVLSGQADDRPLGAGQEPLAALANVDQR